MNKFMDGISDSFIYAIGLCVGITVITLVVFGITLIFNHVRIVIV